MKSTAGFFESNLSCINQQPRYHRLLGDLAIESVDSIPQTSWEPAKLTGDPVPSIETAGKPLFLTSRYDPVSEARKTADIQEAASLLILVGFGVGYLAESLQEKMNRSPSTERLLVIEFLPELLRGSLARREMRGLFRDPRILVVLVANQQAMFECIAQNYVPQLHQSLRILFPPVVQKLAESCNLEVDAWLHEAISGIQGDFITQTRLGKRWLYNLACNIRWTAGSFGTDPLPLEGECLVLGAGPGLEKTLPRIRELQTRGIPTLVCDAALPFCLEYGLKIDWLMTIDGQSITYLHLLSAARPGNDRSWVTIMDLGAHPAWSRNSSRVSFVGSRHPLIAYLRQEGCNIPELDTQGGNVGQSMVTWASLHGASSIHVFGLDFAYLDGRPYARPGFFYDDAACLSQRLSTFEQKVAGLYMDQDFTIDHRFGVLRQVTPRLAGYRRQFEEMIGNLDSAIMDYGQEPELHLNAGVGSADFLPKLAADPEKPKKTSNDPAKILRQYAKLLARPDFCETDPLILWEHGNRIDRRLVATLLPLMAFELAFLLKTGKQSTDSRKEAFFAACNHTRDVLNRFFT